MSQISEAILSLTDHCKVDDFADDKTGSETFAGAQNARSKGVRVATYHARNGGRCYPCVVHGEGCAFEVSPCRISQLSR